MKYAQEPFFAVSGAIQPCEMIEAKIDLTDPLTGSRYKAWRRCVYLGVNDNNHVIIQHPGTGRETMLMLNRVNKIA